MEARLPSWIRHRDGRVVPFEADDISQLLFAATEELGTPNAFLARELADGVLHFLAREDLGETAPAEQIAEIAAKVLNELGQPELARRFADQWTATPILEASPAPRTLIVPFHPGEPPATLARRALEEYSLRAVFAPDVAAAHREGLIQLGGLSAPDRLSGVVLDPSTDLDELTAFGRARAGIDWILDGADWWLGDSADTVSRVAATLDRVAADLAMNVWVHLHTGEAPAWAQHRGEGPLFGGHSRAEPPSAAPWLQALARSSSRLRPVWHWHGEAVSGSIFVEAGKRLGPRGGIHFDRPRRPFLLSRGASRQRPAVLLEVQLNLPRLLDLPDIRGQGERVLDKLPSLVRMAVSAGVQKRKYLRRHAEHLGRGFLLDRAVVRLIPCGLDALVRRLLNVSVLDTKLARGLGRRILTALHRPLEAEHRSTGLNLTLAAPPEPIVLAKPSLDAWSELLRGVTEAIVTVTAQPPPNDRPIDLLPLYDHAWRATDLAGLVWSPPETSRIQQPELGET